MGFAPPRDSVVIGALAPDFRYKDPLGQEHRLRRLRGHPVVVYFWASWCGLCQSQADDLRLFYERHHAQGLEILAVSYDTDSESMNRFRKAHGETWPNSFSGRMFWDDPVGRLYRADSAGAAYLIAPDGRLDGIYYSVAELEGRVARWGRK